MAPAVGFVGFGEAAFAMARGFREAGLEDLSAYDVLADDPERGAHVRGRAAEAGVRLVGSPAELARGARVVFSSVVAGAAIEVAEATAPHLTPEHRYVDINSTSPGVKRAAAGAIGRGGGGRFIEAAVMAAVPPHRQRVPMLLCGEGAAEFAALMEPYGMRLEVLGPEVGAASAIKMLRSVVIKGLEALLLECLLGAERHGVGERVLASVGESFPGLDWVRLAHYLLGRTALHAGRRAHEMDEVAATLAELGVEPVMARAAAERLRRCAELGVQEEFAGVAPERFEEVVAAIERRAGGAG